MRYGALALLRYVDVFRSYGRIDLNGVPLCQGTSGPGTRRAYRPRGLSPRSHRRGSEGASESRSPPFRVARAFRLEGKKTLRDVRRRWHLPEKRHLPTLRAAVRGTLWSIVRSGCLQHNRNTRRSSGTHLATSREGAAVFFDKYDDSICGERWYLTSSLMTASSGET